MRFSIWELLLILVIILVLFGGSRLRNLGGDLGAAIRGFRDSMKEGAKPDTAADEPRKLDQPASAERGSEASATTARDPLAKDRDKV
ncbi:MAG TPA: twin-arginine translocase TatA/TatE family subunit [Candidatus Competibacteraceae bacterium]|nr:MAG: twin-arginine translocase TatA/TatE family subunit [Candidatus Competibacteraceae bacterium]HNW79030.1 twin-arginine translocase TatA/TatE family subunit [Candidatus Competibacteraceae bacterium]HQC72841.1 twin-arginine translocase TatA/TatE family subunit [Candidatus Competibacteraceae bacterium]